MLFFYSRDVLGEIWDLNESVFEGFLPTIVIPPSSISSIKYTLFQPSFVRMDTCRRLLEVIRISRVQRKTMLNSLFFSQIHFFAVLKI